MLTSRTQRIHWCSLAYSIASDFLKPEVLVVYCLLFILEIADEIF